jgi:hypothetical protein
VRLEPEPVLRPWAAPFCDVAVLVEVVALVDVCSITE